MTDPRIQLFLQAVDQAFDKKSWHGTTLRGSVRGLTLDAALWRPGPERRSVWELVLHTTYWKYIVRRRLSGDKTLRFSRKPSNWPSPPETPTQEQLKEDIVLLTHEHQLLRDVIREFPATKLPKRAPESTWTYADHIHGIAAHDLYHAGQIQLLKRLLKERAVNSKQ